MPSWRKKVRKISGHMRVVKVKKTAKGERIRVLGHRNTTDSNASKINRNARKKGIWNFQDSGRTNHKK